MFETARVRSKTIQGEFELRETKLGITSSYNFKGKLLIAIEEGWRNFFADDPTFEVVIDKNNRLTLKGPVIHSQRDPTVAQEDKHV